MNNKYLVSLVSGAVLFALAVLLYGIEVVPVFGHPIFTIILSVTLSTVIITVEVLPLWFMAQVLKAIGDDKSYTRKEVSGLSAIMGCLVLLYAAVVVFAHPWIMTSVVASRVEWFPDFSYWQYLSIGIASFVISLVMSNDTEKTPKQTDKEITEAAVRDYINSRRNRT